MTDFIGTQGDDVIVGTADNDTIYSGSGADTVDGGAGDDVIYDGTFNGSLWHDQRTFTTLLRGGVGNDQITGYYFASIFDTLGSYTVDVRIEAGDGNDFVDVGLESPGSVVIDLGAGNDVANIVGRVVLTTGAGRDHVVLGAANLSMTLGDAVYTITDFTAGNAGDSVDVSALISFFYRFAVPAYGTVGENPFSTGHLRLVQDGADTLVRLDINGGLDGPSRDNERDIVRLVGVTASQLTAANFGGWAPGGATPASPNVTGTADADRLVAGPVGATLSGLGGNDILTGGFRNDRLDGGDGHDQLVGGFGADTLIGGAGNDTIADDAGNDVVDGGDGDDTITLSRRQWQVEDVGYLPETLSVSAGAGNDRVTLEAVYDAANSGRFVPTQASVDLGIGDDRIVVSHELAVVTITTGAGRDTIVYRSGTVTVTDFAAGVGGDVIDMDALLTLVQLPSGTNAFAAGFLRLVQSGADTLVVFDGDGIDGFSFTGSVSDAATPMVRLLNVQAGQLVADNFGGFDPRGTPIVTVPPVATAGADTLTGTGGADTISGLDGDDRISGGAGADTLSGDGGNDTIEGGDGNDILNGGIGNDTLTDTVAGSDTINGGDGDDRIVVTHDYLPAAETITIFGGAGADQVRVGLSASSGQPGNVVADLGSGNDIYTFDSPASGGTVLTLGTGSDRIVLPALLASNGVQFTGMALTVTDFQTGAGGDQLDWAGLATNLTFDSAPLRSLLGNRDFGTFAHSDERLAGFNPFAIRTARLVQVGADTHLQIARFPMNVPGYSAQATTDFLTFAVFSNTSASSFTAENLGFDPSYVTHAGTAGNDTLTGTAGRDVIDGGDGGDTLNGGDGNDVLRGGDGNDALTGGLGNDQLFSGFGDDTVVGGDGNDTIDGGAGFDIIDGGAGADLISDFNGGDNLTGGAGDDFIEVFITTAAVAGAGQIGNRISAGDGNDTVVMGADSYHAPTLPAYVVDLGAGDDIFIGAGRGRGEGEPVQTLTLGAGRDRVQAFTGVITDFQTGVAGDSIDVASILLSLGNTLVYRNLVQVLAGQDPFANGFATLRQNGANVELDLDLSGTGSFAATGVGAVTFVNTTVAAFTSANFNGFSPVASLTRPIVIGETATTVTAGQSVAISNPLPDFYARHAGIIYASTSGQGQFSNAGSVTVQQVGSGGDLSGFGVYPDPGVDASNANLFHNTATGQFRVVVDILPPAAATAMGLAYQSSRTIGFNAITWSAFTPALPLINDGHFDVTTDVGTAYAAYGNVQVINRGTMNVSSGFDAIGFRAASVDNAGSISVQAAEIAIGFFYEPQQGPDTLVNRAGATVTVTTLPSSPYATIGVFVNGVGFSTSDAPVEILNNAGTLTADIAYWSYVDGGSHFAEQITNAGTINGRIFVSTGDDRIINTGVINGAILLGDGNDHFSGARGQVSGTVEGGAGDDFVEGGTSADFLYGDSGDDIIFGGEGDDLIDGGSGANTLDGGMGTNTLSYVDQYQAVTVDLVAGTATGAYLNDTLHNFANVYSSQLGDAIRGDGAANMLFGLGGADTIDGREGVDVVWGGRGDDTLTGGAGADVFWFTPGDGIDTVTDLGTGDVIRVFGYTAAQSIVQQGADVRVNLSGTDALIVRNTTVAALNAQTLLFTSGMPSVNVPAAPATAERIVTDFVIGQGVTYTINDTIPTVLRDVRYAESVGFALAGNRTQSGVTLWNAGSIIVDTSDDALIGAAISNSIYDPYTGRAHVFVNAATAVVEARGDNPLLTGVQGMASVWNAGSILVVGSDVAWGIRGSGGLVEGSVLLNSGTITVEGRVATGLGVPLGTSAGADLTINSGQIVVRSTEAGVGLGLSMEAHPVVTQPDAVNSGTITVTDQTATRDSVGIHVRVSSHAQLWNSGTITADYAVRAPANTSSTDHGQYSLSLYNSGTLNGAVELSIYHDVLINTHVINGDVFLNNGDDLYDSRAGTHVGIIDGYDGNDRIWAGAGSQQLLGGFGDDTLSGGAGADTLTGGAGRDVFVFAAGDGADVITDFATGAEHDFIDVVGYTAYQSMVQSGADVVITFAASNTLTLRGVTLAAMTPAMIRFGATAMATSVIPSAPAMPALPAMPTPPSTGPFDMNALGPAVNGTSVGEVLAGSSGNDDIRGNDGDDTISGFMGNDLLIGGEGNDTLEGGDGSDVLLGGNGDDTLAGGAGSNELHGGAGNDTYIVVNRNDSTIEAPGAGTDTVRTALSVYQLQSHVENLTLIGAFAHDAAIGNDLNNTIIGGTGRDALYGLDGNDTLHDGGGGEGNEDTMLGGNGDDVFVVTVRGSSTIETAGGGYDEVRTTFNLYQLQANIEALIFTDDARHQAGVGNALDNVLRGGQGSDDLFGRAGNDTLYGGAGAANTLLGQEGDDLYIVEAVGDSVFEYANEGTDTVEAHVATFTLPNHVENLRFGGTGAFAGFGNALNNEVRGGSGNDFLNGFGGDDIIIGGAGADELQGGEGADQFRYFGGETGQDRIYDFVAGTDRIMLSTSGFARTATVSFVQGAGAVANTTNATFLLDTATGIVSYDPDGTGSADAIVLAQINVGVTLTINDFGWFGP